MSSSNQGGGSGGGGNSAPLRRKDKVDESMRLKSATDAKPKPKKGDPKPKPEHPIFGRTSMREASSRGE
ncbi:hypothetical protein NKR19_g3668 [Coniochaeta hoffmannii]|uniref:Uncharacterized protein n=1 Tax=Coniochaeta hoffmannii TaxID=91930 RepID=A0AA38RVH7_9PEZI|nr:hypothetical protein NKR19_g3668 [Coniochaeta hoffmannii]